MGSDGRTALGPKEPGAFFKGRQIRQAKRSRDLLTQINTGSYGPWYDNLTAVSATSRR